MILARHAEALFWAGRLLERAEHTTRVLDIATRDSMHFRASPSQPEWKLIVEAIGLANAFAESERQASATDVAEFLFIDAAVAGSVATAVGQLRENIRTVRDRVPVELWEEANRLHLALLALDGHLPSEPFELYSTVRRRCHAMSGVVGESMPRDDSFTFFVVGRMIERAVATCRIVRFLVMGDPHTLDDGAVLRMVASLQAYRRRSGNGSSLALSEFLLQADDVPRTVLSCLRRADSRLRRLGENSPGLGPALMICGRVRSTIEYGDTGARLREDPHELLIEIEAELRNLSAAIAEHAFDPAQLPTMQAQFIRPGLER